MPVGAGAGVNLCLLAPAEISGEGLLFKSLE